MILVELQVISQCPDLYMHEKGIDKALERTLIDAKHYQTTVKPVSVSK